MIGDKNIGFRSTEILFSFSHQMYTGEKGPYGHPPPVVRINKSKSPFVWQPGDQQIEQYRWNNRDKKRRKYVDAVEGIEK